MLKLCICLVSIEGIFYLGHIAVFVVYMETEFGSSRKLWYSWKNKLNMIF